MRLFDLSEHLVAAGAAPNRRLARPVARLELSYTSDWSTILWTNPPYTFLTT
jgi:hypothetical protein